jgi:quercetin dioxygenase-like cupin family protein
VRRAGAEAPGHHRQEERFTVVDGTMRFRLGRRSLTASAGETIVVPAWRVHRFANAGEGTARVRVEVTPLARRRGLAARHA